MSHQAAINSNFLTTIKDNFKNFWLIAIPYLILMLLLRLVEVIWVFKIHPLDFQPINIILGGLIRDFEWIFYLLGFFLLLNVLIGFFLPRTIEIITRIMITFLLIIHGGLIFYFTKSLFPLGDDLYAYSTKDIIATLKASGVINVLNGVVILVLVSVIYFFTGLGKRIRISFNTALVLSGICYGYLLVFNLIAILSPKPISGMETNLKANKSFYLYDQSYSHFTAESNLYFDFYLANTNDENQLMTKKYLNSEYPFLHENNYPDVLGPFFNEFDSIPDLVFIIVEGLGKAYSGEDAYLRSFTPFLDSLANHSLYWKNNLSTTGRTYGILTGMFGSLPFSKNGFMENAPNLPKHSSLFSLLKHNGYYTNFHIGADINFDKVGSFLNYQQVDRILDLTSFDPDFEVTPSTSGFSWGYPDKAVFENGMRKLPRNHPQPQMTVFQTQTSHDPFIIPNEEKYQAMLLTHLTNTLKVKPSEMASYLSYKSLYASVLYVDEAVKEFFEEYKKMPKYENTIFIITGDHRLPEIPMATRIDRFHVPLMIYSPKLSRTKRIHGVSTHFDIAPSILSFLSSRYPMDLPSAVAWKGSVLDTAANFQSFISVPLMRNKTQLKEYISGEYLISENELYKISDNMNIDIVQEIGLKDKISGKFENYKNSNTYSIESDRLLPDSLMIYNRKK
ncbi:hypothetical protein P872_20085 [Rhodonellum psychrophilum GCM71 = DSM 17998]|uniref:Sulfatase N-terminal domain-containing protein n=2 Tax=Rhodonellum TaxID=336827 RepID=U5BUN1_9BACT|nr:MULTISPECIES: LTA synthase family protein [Rhodonellum]ERM81588.1 hypothetical protein P872_20085 [Rhodonellum psychrophilum GCM71 = DSM 17998]SDZ37078.1 uncharacterized sulfatase [Rhodonellum ikkaensis]